MQAGQPPTPTPYKTLTQAQVDSFWTNGYLPIGKILNDEEIEQINSKSTKIYCLNATKIILLQYLLTL